MPLFERQQQLDQLEALYRQLAGCGGSTILLMGEAGMGKTALVHQFTRSLPPGAPVYTGACDSLFTPIPLGPLYDIAAQMNNHLPQLLQRETDRATVFAELYRVLLAVAEPMVLIIEDLHWADEATLDLVKFLVRRMPGLRCLCILTYRHNEIHPRHPLRYVLGELPSSTFSRLHLPPLTPGTVEQLAREAGISGRALYSLTGGNPFYVREVLAGDRNCIPENVKDAVFALLHRLSDEDRRLWELLSVVPSRLETALLEELEPAYQEKLQRHLDTGIFLTDGPYLLFKHELFRRAVEESLVPERRRELNAQWLTVMLQRPERGPVLARLVHHAREAGQTHLVGELAPEAARQASAWGGHREASRLYQAAIEHAPPADPVELARLHEANAYECYLTNQIAEAIASQQKALELWKVAGERLKMGNALRFLSRLWWFQGNRERAETLGLQAIAELENGFPTRERAGSYSNMAQLKMLADEMEEASYWGRKAIELAEKMDDMEVLSHALNNLGTVHLNDVRYEAEGENNLRRSLELALRHGYQEHVARAYTNLSSTWVINKKYDQAETALREGIAYCEELDLDSWTYYMLSWKARLYLERGQWPEAHAMAQRLYDNDGHPPVVRISALVVLSRLLMRTDTSRAWPFLEEARCLALPTGEPQRIVPVSLALLEYEWLTGRNGLAAETLRAVQALLKPGRNYWYYRELLFWATCCGYTDTDVLRQKYPGISFDGPRREAGIWAAVGCPYEQAVALAGGDAAMREEALAIFTALQATVPAAKMRRSPEVPPLTGLPEALTRRQVEVLRLLHTGLRNADIARQLYISPKTVDHHVSAILAKLTVQTRTEAVARARELGIL